MSPAPPTAPAVGGHQQAVDAILGPRVLRAILLVLWLAALLAGLAHRLVEGEWFSLNLLLLAVSTGALVALHLGWWRGLFSAFLWAVELLALAAATRVDGLMTPGLVPLPVLLLLAAWLADRRQVIAMLALAALAIPLIGWAQSHGWLQRVERPPLVWALAYATACGIGALWGYAYSNGLRAQYRRVRVLGARLHQANRELEVRVAARGAELAQAITELRQTGADLVRTAKLAGLGRQVGELSRALSVPVSQGLDHTARLSARAARLRSDFEAGNLKRSALLAALDEIGEIAGAAESAAERAAALIGDFKTAAAEQTAERRRVFPLREAITTALARGAPPPVDAPPLLPPAADTICDSYPEVLTSVVLAMLRRATPASAGTDIASRLEVATGGERLRISIVGEGPWPPTPSESTATQWADGERLAGAVLGGELVSEPAPDGVRYTLSVPRRAPGKV